MDILQLKSQNVKIKEESYIRLTQENPMEFLLQTSRSYILQTMVCAHTTTNLP